MSKINRNSNIELLRLIAIYLITQAHFVIPASKLSPSFLQNMSSIFALGGSLGVNIFILITSYFIIDKSFSIKRISKILKQVLFYTIMLAIPWFFFTDSSQNIVDWIITIPRQYWFVTAYIIFLLTTPLLDWGLKKLKSSQINILKCVTFLIFSLIPSVLGINIGPLRVLVFYFLYIFVYYLKKHEIDKSKMNSRWIIILFFIILLYFFVVLLSNHYELDVSIFTYIKQKHLQNNVFQVVITCALFELFIRKKYRYNSLINKITGSVFAVYLIQEHGLFLA